MTIVLKPQVIFRLRGFIVVRFSQFRHVVHIFVSLVIQVIAAEYSG